MALYASVVGDSSSDLVLILVAAPFAILALTMGPAELTARRLTRPIAIGFVVITGYSIYRLGFRPRPKILQEP